MADARQREYFYFLDGQGRVVHDGTVLDDAHALDTFCRRLRRNETGRHGDHPFVTQCAGELNFLRCADGRSALVFRRLEGGRLLYAASLSVPFEPGALRHSEDGRLYHPAPVGDLGLLSPALVLALASSIDERGGTYCFRHGGALLPIRPL